MKNIMKLVLVLVSSLMLFSCAGKKKQKAVYMGKTYKELKEKLPEATVTLLNDSIKVLFPENLMFATSSAEINPAFAPKMATFGTILNRYHKTSILINGYTDNTGSAEVNNKLSNDRATSAKSSLLNQNVDKSRLHAWGHGSKDPLGSNDTPEGRQKNRRVEFVVLYNVD